MSRLAVSVGAELAVLLGVIEATEDLLDGEKVLGSDDAAARRRARALLALAGSRVAQLRRVIVGAEDAGILVARHNEARSPPDPADDPDLLLVPG